MFKDKNVLVAGGTGMIGIPLVEMLIQEGARVRIASLDDGSRAHPQSQFLKTDLRSFENCLKACEGMDQVFNLLCIKGSPATCATKPASLLTPMLVFNTNLLEAARQSGVKGYLYTSSIGVYSPAPVFYEDEVWKTLPSPHDRFAGWAKRMGELQVEAFKIEYGWKNLTVARVCNVYGPYDNFDRENAMVVPSLIRRAVEGENPFRVWGDGSPERDFLHAKDAARGILLAAQKGEGMVLNIGSGKGLSIRKLVDTILSGLSKKPNIIFDVSKPAGDKIRIMNIDRARSIGFEPQISIEEGVKETMVWYEKNREVAAKRYDVFEMISDRKA